MLYQSQLCRFPILFFAIVVVVKSATTCCTTSFSVRASAIAAETQVHGSSALGRTALCWLERRATSTASSWFLAIVVVWPLRVICNVPWE